MIAQTLSLATSVDLCPDTLLQGFLFKPLKFCDRCSAIAQLCQWQKEVLIQNFSQVFRLNIIRRQIVLWQGLNYNLFNPPVWGGSQLSVTTHRGRLARLLNKPAKEPCRCYNLFPFSMDFYPLLCRGKNYFVDFFFESVPFKSHFAIPIEQELALSN